MRLYVSWHKKLALPGTSCLQVAFQRRRWVVLPKRPGFLKASQLIYAVLVSQLNPLLASDLTTFLLCTMASFFLGKGSGTDLFPTQLTFAFCLSHPTSSSSLENLKKEFCHPGLSL